MKCTMTALLASLIISSLASRDARADISSDYHQALGEANAQHWSSVVRYLKPYRSTSCAPPVHYLLGVAFANLRNPQGAFDEEAMAIACLQNPQDPIRQDALKLMRWAVEQLSPRATETSTGGVVGQSVPEHSRDVDLLRMEGEKAQLEKQNTDAERANYNDVLARARTFDPNIDSELLHLKCDQDSAPVGSTPMANSNGYSAYSNCAPDNLGEAPPLVGLPAK